MSLLPDVCLLASDGMHLHLLTLGFTGYLMDCQFMDFVASWRYLVDFYCLGPRFRSLIGFGRE